MNIAMKREFKATGFARGQKNAMQYITTFSFSFFFFFFFFLIMFTA